MALSHEQTENKMGEERNEDRESESEEKTVKQEEKKRAELT